MPRLPLILQSELPYHVSARSINKDWFNIPMNEVWNIMSEQLFLINRCYGTKIFSFVLMSNHFHMLIRTPNNNLDKCMSWFMRETSRELTRRGNRINQAYGGRYHKSIINCSQYYLNAYKYIYHNPIQAGMCENILDYPYSTIQGLLGMTEMLIPIEEDEILFENIEGTLTWINQRPSERNWDSVRRALRRREFRLPNINKKPNPLENDTL